jgi:hypothetical protein
VYREIKKKRLILDNRKPFKSEVAAYIRELNTLDWISSSIRLDGMTISKENILKIIRGEFVTDCSIAEHLQVRNYCDVIKLVEDMTGMGIQLTVTYIFKLYQALAKPDVLVYRRSNPVLREIDYIPPHFNDIDEQMEILIQWLKAEDLEANPIMKAAQLHNKMIEIYPFEDHTRSMARVVMQYELIRSGFPPILLQMSEQEDNLAIMNYLKTEDTTPLYDTLLRGVFNKLEVLLQLTS